MRVNAVGRHCVQEPSVRAVWRKQEVGWHLPGEQQSPGVGRCVCDENPGWREHGRFLIKRVAGGFGSLPRTGKDYRLAVEQIYHESRRPLWRGHKKEAQVVSIVEEAASRSNHRMRIGRI